MGQATKIEWTDATWNPWHGCIKLTPGCAKCYMYRQKRAYGQDPREVVRSKTSFRDPLKWDDPRLVFACSWSDWFIAEADPWRDEAWDVIRRCPHHTFQILTKRPERIRPCLPRDWPLANVWLGVSAEDPKHGLPRIDILRGIPAVTRFVSFEPLLEDLGAINLHGIHWVIVGGESGPDYRSTRPEWVDGVFAQCQAAGIPFFFKQWGGTRHIDGAWGGRTYRNRTWNDHPAVADRPGIERFK